MDSYEKKYKEALKKAEEIIKYYKERNRDEASIEDLGTIFPELKESEDERIRKALVRFHGSTIDIDGIKGSDIVAWLEKQSKQKPNPYSGVSFEYNGHTWGICARDGGVEILTDGNLKAFVSLDKSFVYPVNPIPDIKPKSALEGINEAKVDNSNSLNIADEYSGLTDFEGTLADVCIGWIGKELGWKQYIKDNADVLLKIAIKKFNSVQDASFEQKSAKWSKEDEVGWTNTMIMIKESASNHYTKDSIKLVIDWLNSLKQRIKWKPSDEQMNTLEYYMHNLISSEHKEVLFGLYDQLKKLREEEL